MTEGAERCGIAQAPPRDDRLSILQHDIIEAAKRARKDPEAGMTFKEHLWAQAREMCPIDVGYRVVERNEAWALDLWWRE